MKVGDLVKIRSRDDDNMIGIVTWVNMQYPPNCGILIDGQPVIEDLRVVEVINESR
jgi:hypothetical protein